MGTNIYALHLLYDTSKSLQIFIPTLYLMLLENVNLGKVSIKVWNFPYFPKLTHPTRLICFVKRNVVDAE